MNREMILAEMGKLDIPAVQARFQADLTESDMLDKYGTRGRNLIFLEPSEMSDFDEKYLFAMYLTHYDIL